MNNSLNISSAKYSVDPITGETASVVIVVDGETLSVLLTQPIATTPKSYAK